MVEASYVGNRNVWQATGGFQDFNGISQQLLSKYNFTVGNLADATLLNTQLQLANSSTLAAKGVFLPYGNFPRNQTVLQSIKTYAQYMYQQAVVLKLMPMNNATQITDDERALIRRWRRNSASSEAS